MPLVESLQKAFKIPDLRKRISFTLLMFLIYRIGAHVPVPGVDPEKMQQLFEQGSLFGLLDLFAGGALRLFTVFAMGIMPYINASIIVQLLTVVIPRFEQLAKEGQEGRKKLTQYTRYGTVLLGVIQGIGFAYLIRNYGVLINDSLASIALIVLVLTAGTAFLMWIGELITENGIGNGISLLIFAGIVARLPGGAVNLWTYLQSGRINYFNILVMAVLALGVIAGIVWVTQGQRRIPVQYAKRVVGRRQYGGASTHIPIRVNQAGVIPVIFAAAILSFPATLAQFIQAPWAQSIAAALDFGTPLYTSLYALMIVFFTYFYTAVTFNPQDVADNIKQYGGFVPGIRPGRPTAQYLAKVLERITLAGALFLAAVSILPVFIGPLTNIPNLYFGGTALLIVVGVSLETMKQIEAHMLMRHYQGFMK